MMRAIVLAAVLLTACAAGPKATVGPESIVVMRGERPVPVTLYRPDATGPAPLAILSPGYGMEATAYSFIADALRARGYLVAAVTQVLSSDPPVPSGDNLYVRRMPSWMEGVANTDAVIAALEARGEIAAGAPVVMIGHSHGGDIAMLFARERPARVAAAVSLDNRRMPLPRTAKPRICSARSVDLAADPGVLPSVDEQAALGMLIRPVAAAHNDMWDGATAAQKAEMLGVIAACLPSRP